MAGIGNVVSRFLPGTGEASAVTTDIKGDEPVNKQTPQAATGVKNDEPVNKQVSAIVVDDKIGETDGEQVSAVAKDPVQASVVTKDDKEDKEDKEVVEEEKDKDENDKKLEMLKSIKLRRNFTATAKNEKNIRDWVNSCDKYYSALLFSLWQYSIDYFESKVGIAEGEEDDEKGLMKKIKFCAQKLKELTVKCEENKVAFEKIINIIGIKDE